MVRDLGDYHTPRDVWERIDPLGLTIQRVGAGGREAVMAFEDRYFPRWSRWFREPDNQVLAAGNARDGVVASLLLEGPESASPFTPMLGTDMGTIGCVGVGEEHQGRGIGTALVARASELLRARGVRRCHIGWIERERFYRRSGYRRWRVFLMCRRSLSRTTVPTLPVLERLARALGAELTVPTGSVLVGSLITLARDHQPSIATASG